MGLDNGPGDAQQGGAPYLVGTHNLLKLLQPSGDQQGSQLGGQVLLKHPLHLPGQEQAGALHGLEEDVARIAVGHDDIHRALHCLPSLHIAYEVDAAGLGRLLQHGIDCGLKGGAL